MGTVAGTLELGAEKVHGRCDVEGSSHEYNGGKSAHVGVLYGIVLMNGIAMEIEILIETNANRAAGKLVTRRIKV